MNEALPHDWFSQRLHIRLSTLEFTSDNSLRQRGVSIVFDTCMVSSDRINQDRSGNYERAEKLEMRHPDSG